jgi:signal peptidase I
MRPDDILKTARNRLEKAMGRAGELARPGSLAGALRAGWEWMREPALMVAIVLASTTAIAQPFYVPSGSMEPTLQIGDEIMTAKYSYGYGKYAIPFGSIGFVKGRLFADTPERGDVVVFHPVSDPHHNWVKRVIGLPGDRVQMRDGHLWINGRALTLRVDGTGFVENGDGFHREVPRYVETLPGGREHPIFKWQWHGPLDNTDEVMVPEGHIFVMGDNRDDSFDSRVPLSAGGIGFVPLDNLVGHAKFVLGSVDYLNASSILEWPAEFRLSRLFKPFR